MKNKLFKIFSFILRQFLICFPSATPSLANFLKSVFSPFFNEKITLPSGLGLPLLQDKILKTNSMHVHIVLPIQTELVISDYIQASSFYSGLPPICATLIEHAHPRALFFDIGANIGLVSLAVSKVLPASSIHAFEVNPETFSKLESNFNTNCSGAHAHQIGISDQSGSMRLSVISNDSGSSTLELQRFEQNSYCHGQKISAKMTEVKVVTFDSWAAQELQISHTLTIKKFLFKIDVEGHELKALIGMKDFLKRNHEKEMLFVVECENKNIADVREFFVINGFKEHRPCWNLSLEVFPHHTDLVFIKNV